MSNIDKRVKDKLPAPTHCHLCRSKVNLVENKAIYGRNYGDWPYSYLCESKQCGAYVGCHPDTYIPLGTLADKTTREARKKAKDAFNKIWLTDGFMSRKKSYKKLAELMGIPSKECHFGWFDYDMCEKAYGICNQQLDKFKQDFTND